MLGLDHSEVASDLMYRTEHNPAGSASQQPALSRRDVQMLAWLYAQKDYVPIGR